jgi:hypothetical protein
MYGISFGVPIESVGGYYSLEASIGVVCISLIKGGGQRRLTTDGMVYWVFHRSRDVEGSWCKENGLRNPRSSKRGYLIKYTALSTHLSKGYQD